jgi:hypothetical protein
VEEERWAVCNGLVLSWLPAEGGDVALWHVRHEDGDEEDLEEHEVRLPRCPVCSRSPLSETLVTLSLAGCALPSCSLSHRADALCRACRLVPRRCVRRSST